MTTEADLSAFADSYAQARTKFLAAAREAGAALESHTHSLTGPSGETLATDVAWLGPRDAASVLMVVSGTHGVEGYCGSGAQVAWLRRGEASRLGADMAAVLVHGLNPHGFAWMRRVTEDNVDLNRNWFDFNAPAPPETDFEAVADLLDPPAWTAATLEAARTGLRSYAAQHGAAAMVAAVSGGQHRHPRSLFFGGSAETWSRRTLSRIFRETLAVAVRVAIVDLHSGLGAAGLAEVIVTAPEGSEVHRRARAWYGSAVIPAGGTGSVSAPIHGDWIAAAPRHLPWAEVTAVALEFGTAPSAQVLDALLADNWLHNDPSSASAPLGAVARQMRHAFYVDTDLWRGMVLGQTLATLRSAVAGLGMPSPITR
jgi:Protein of unknown function (DUF2817)